MTAFKDENAKKNKWYFVIETKENGKRKRIKRRGFATKKVAEAAERELIGELEKGLDLKASETLYKDYMADWLNDKKHRVKLETWDMYQRLVMKHILPQLGEQKMCDLTPRHIQKLYNLLQDAEALSGENLQKLHGIVKGSLQKASDWGMIIKNPAALVERPKAEKKEMLYWTHEQSIRFLQASEKDRYYYVFLLAITTGMRQGEILGLRWRDVDLDSKTIAVRSTLNHKGTELRNTTKTTAGTRAIGIDAHTAQRLYELKQRTAEEKEKHKDLYDDKDLVFATELGNYVTPRNLMRSFYRLTENAKVPKIRFHDLRHTHVVFLLKMQENNKRIAERLGWSSVKMLDRYAHITPHMQQETAEAFGEQFFSAPEGTK